MAGASHALTVVRRYHEAWWSRDFPAAAELLDENLITEMPINKYEGKTDFFRATEFTRGMASGIKSIAGLGDTHKAVLIYDMTLPIGDLRVVEYFTVEDGRITELWHIHDTAALRGAGAGAVTEE